MMIYLAVYVEYFSENGLDEHSFLNTSLVCPYSEEMLPVKPAARYLKALNGMKAEVVAIDEVKEVSSDLQLRVNFMVIEKLKPMI